MRVIAFPGRRMTPAEAQAIAELEAALDGDGTGAAAEEWRELRADVRSLTAPIDPSFVAKLERSLREQAPAQRRARRTRRPLRTLVLRGGLASAGAVVVAVVVLAAAGVVGGGRTAAVSGSAPSSATAPTAHRHGTAIGAGSAEASAGGSSAANGPRIQGTLQSSPSSRETSANSGEAPGLNGERLQQLAASLTLGAGSEGVQNLADRVGRIAVEAGGYVQSSRVQRQQGSAGEATLTLQLPSAKFSAALEQLQRSAHVRSENQSLQDLTGEYDAVGGRLAAAKGEREALLRALAHAETSAAVESLHARIAQADSKIAAAEAQRARINHSAARSEVEVTVLGEASTSGLTLSRGLHDAGHVLAVSLAVLLIVAAVLVPLAILLGALFALARQWRRRRREAVLGSS